MVLREGKCVGGVEGWSVGSVMWSRTNQLSVLRKLSRVRGTKKRRVKTVPLRMVRKRRRSRRWLISGERRRRGRGSEEEQGRRRAEDVGGALPNRLCRAAQQTTKRDGESSHHNYTPQVR